MVCLSGHMFIEWLETYCPWFFFFFLFFLAQMTILWHQVAGSPIGIGSMTPNERFCLGIL